MNPGLVVKLRPSGPWRIGPDSGARNRVDVIYHSDSLYSAVTSAMSRVGSLEPWLDATARNGKPAVSFSSCFPFLDEIGFIIPPRTLWPPSSPALLSARVRWKSARFVPLGIVQALVNGQTLDENHWSIDGPSECLVPAGRPGPFRTGLRWCAAVDRLSGSAERHSTACIEFRPGSGLWTVISFADEAAYERWLEPLKAVFRLLADSGFGGERSRGWGHAEPPEFIEGTLPDMILAPRTETPPEPEPPMEEPPLPTPPVEEPPPVEPPPVEPPEPEPPATSISAPSDIALLAETTVVAVEPAVATEPAVIEPAAPAIEPEVPAVEAEPAATDPEPPAIEPEPPAPEPVAEMVEEPTGPEQPHWLLSLFIPGPGDTVDWARGNYQVLERGGRIESPVRSGELKKQIQMIAEGSVVYAASAPSGSATDVAPDGFAHPVYRGGFAVSIPLGEVR